MAIIGGGLGGLAAAAALRGRGFDAHVFEAAADLLRPSTGTGIMISANGFEALGAIESTLPNQMRARGARITSQSVHVCDPSGAELRGFTSDATKFLELYGAEQFNIAWAKAHEILAGAVPPEAIHCGCTFESYSVPADERERVDVRFSDGRSVRCALVVGADGAGSKVRRLVAGEAGSKARANGQLLWNALIPSDAVPDAHGDGCVEFTTCGKDGQAILAFDAGEGTTSWYLTLMEDDAPPNVREAMATGDFGGFGRAGVREELERVFAAWPLAVDCLRATPEDQIFERRLADRVPILEWADSSGRVVVIGDAAHPMIPSQGQGTMMTWEDAADLSASLAAQKKAAKGSLEAVPTAVAEFTKRRVGRCNMVQEFSRKAYMGRPSPTDPEEVAESRERIGEIYGGYTPLC